MIRPATSADLTALMPLYDNARAFMAANGNPTQWKHSPSQETLEADIARGDLYVIEENGRIEGVFACILGEDPTYQVIEEGAWLDASPYATLHRVAAAKGCHGVFQRAVAFGETLCPHLRVDTHRDNLPMQHCILKQGFQYCGVIHIADGSPRLAYEKTAK